MTHFIILRVFLMKYNWSNQFLNKSVIEEVEHIYWQSGGKIICHFCSNEELNNSIGFRLCFPHLFQSPDLKDLQLLYGSSHTNTIALSFSKLCHTRRGAEQLTEKMKSAKHSSGRCCALTLLSTQQIVVTPVFITRNSSLLQTF